MIYLGGVPTFLRLLNAIVVMAHSRLSLGLKFTHLIVGPFALNLLVGAMPLHAEGNALVVPETFHHHRLQSQPTSALIRHPRKALVKELDLVGGRVVVRLR